MMSLAMCCHQSHQLGGATILFEDLFQKKTFMYVLN